MSKHTPGPWWYQEESDAYTHIVRANGMFIHQGPQWTNGVAEANARLIAAAPELLEVAKQLVAFVDRAREEGAHGLPQWVLDIAEAARIVIAKAEAQEAVRK